MARGAEGGRPDERAVRDPGRRRRRRRGEVYVLEVNPRASRTVPFVSKATGVPLAKIAARCMVGQHAGGPAGRDRGEVMPPYFSVKEAVFPFNKFPGVDPILGPEMRSTGEVMGVGRTFGEAMLKSQLGAGSRLPTKGTVCITVKNGDKAARGGGRRATCTTLGFQLVATGHRGGDRRGRPSGEGGQQGQGRPAAHRRPAQDRRDPAGLQHGRRDAHRDRRLAPHPHGRARPAGDVLHQHGRLRGGGRGHEAPATTWA